jgi:hypothetical protein
MNFHVFISGHAGSVIKIIKKNAVRRRTVGSDPLSKSAKIIGHAAEPQCAVRSLDEEAIVHGLSSGGMND